MASTLTVKLREHRWIVLVGVAFVLLGTLRLNDLSLYTDSTRYVIWGTSFAHGRGFVDDTQPVPERYVVNVPLFSVLLSPVLLAFPSSLLASKIWTLLWGVVFLALFYRFLLRFFGKNISAIAVLLLAVNPLMLILSTEALSETAYLAFFSLCFLLLEGIERDESSGNRNFLTLLLVTSLIVILREIAVALVGSVVLYFLLRKEYKNALFILIGAALVYGAWTYRNLVLFAPATNSGAPKFNSVFVHFLTPSQAPLLQEFGLRFVNNAKGYMTNLTGMLFFPVPDMLIVDPMGAFLAYYRSLTVAHYVFPFLFLPLFFFGIWRDVRDHRTGAVRIAYIAGYLIILLAYPVQDIRFLLPLLPMMVFYPLVAIEWVWRHWLRDKNILSGTAAVLLGALILLPNVLCDLEIERTNLRYSANPVAFYDHLQQGRLSKNIFTKPWDLVGQAIRKETPEGTIIAAPLKEAAIFIGSRKLLELSNTVPVPMFDHYLRAYAAEYVMSTGSPNSAPSYELQMFESTRFWFEPVCRIAGMQLFKAIPTDLTPREKWLATKRMTIDTTTANGLLILGRTSIMLGRYEEAIASLQRAGQLAPGDVVIPYQLTIAYALAGRFDEASGELGRLYAFGQSTGYNPIAAKILAVARMVREADESGTAPQRSMTLFDASTFYWNIGFPGLAYSILRNSLARDSTYFTGLLWGWHYGMQRGDTAQAKIYLRQLRAIDRNNPVVAQFTEIDQTIDSLRRSSDPMRRAALHLAIARSYKTVDLPDDAIDEAQRALRENSVAVEAWIFQAQLFEEKKAPYAARWAYRHALELDPANVTARAKLSSD